MDKRRALTVMSALSQPIRLDVFLLLARTSPEGMSSGELATATASSPSTMSAHLAILARAGLVTSDKVGRNVVYRAVTDTAADLSSFLADASAAARPGSRRPARDRDIGEQT